MIDRDKVFDAFRNCITEPKCKDCPWEQCDEFYQKKVEIPVTLALDVIELLKEQELRVCCLCGYFDTVENRCKYHKHDVDVSEFCSRWVKRNDDT